MIITERIITLCWLIFVIYWTISGRSVKPTKEVGKKFSNAWLNAGRVFFVILYFEIFKLIPIDPLTSSFIPYHPLLRSLSILLVTIGLFIAITARNNLAKNWSGNVEIKKDHELITTGLYSVVRNPIYTGILSMCVGTFLFAGNVSSLIFLLIMTFFMLYKTKEEEKLLEKHFGEKYLSYKKKVKSLIPFIY